MLALFSPALWQLLGFCHPTFLTKEKTGRLSPASSVKDPGRDSALVLLDTPGQITVALETKRIFGQQIKELQKEEMVPQDRHPFCVNHELSNHSILNLLQSKFITALETANVLTNKKTDE